MYDFGTQLCHKVYIKCLDNKDRAGASSYREDKKNCCRLIYIHLIYVESLGSRAGTKLSDRRYGRRKSADRQPTNMRQENQTE